MIGKNRPIYILLDPRRNTTLMPFDEKYSQVLRYWGKWTISEEPYSEDQWDWVSCDAEFGKTVDGKWHMCKCMEPAMYSVLCQNGGTPDQSNFCEFHRPRITEV